MTQTAYSEFMTVKHRMDEARDRLLYAQRRCAWCDATFRTVTELIEHVHECETRKSQKSLQNQGLTTSAARRGGAPRHHKCQVEIFIRLRGNLTLNRKSKSSLSGTTPTSQISFNLGSGAGRQAESVKSIFRLVPPKPPKWTKIDKNIPNYTHLTLN